MLTSLTHGLHVCIDSTLWTCVHAYSLRYELVYVQLLIVRYLFVLNLIPI